MLSCCISSVLFVVYCASLALYRMNSFQENVKHFGLTPFGGKGYIIMLPVLCRQYQRSRSDQLPVLRIQMSTEATLMKFVFGILFVMAISLAVNARSLIRQSRRVDHSAEDRRCYRPKYFNEGSCRLSEAAHRLRAKGGNNSCTALPQYDCNSLYLATEGPSRHTAQSLTSFCKEGEVSEGLRSRNGYFVTCPFRYVCRHNPSRIPSTYWEAEKLFDRESSVCKAELGSSARCMPITPDMPFLVNQGCDGNVGQYRYRLETIPIIHGYACVRQ